MSRARPGSAALQRKQQPGALQFNFTPVKPREPDGTDLQRAPTAVHCRLRTDIRDIQTTTSTNSSI